jgi:hypothetical protein
MYAYELKLYDATSDRAISHDGKAIIMTNGSPDKVTLYDATGAALANPITITDGVGKFFTAETVSSVDVSIYTEYGYSAFLNDVLPGVPQEVYIDLSRQAQTLIVPFSVADSTAAVETDTGLDLVVGTLIRYDGLGIKVTALDATETIDLGLDGAGAEDDPNGILEAISVAALGWVGGQVGFAVGTNSILVDVTGGTQEFTYGALMTGAGTRLAAKADGTDSATTKNGFYLLENHPIVAASADLTYTLTTGSDTAKGYFVIPTFIPVPAALA